MNQARSAYINARDDYQVPHDLVATVGRYRVVRPRVELERPQYDILAPRKQFHGRRELTFWGMAASSYTLDAALALARDMHRKDDAREAENRADQATRIRQRSEREATEKAARQKEEERRRRTVAVAAARELLSAEDERVRRLDEARRLVAEWDAENDNGRVRP